MGVGMGAASVPLLTIAMAEVPARDAGLASGIVNVSMQVAGALGVAILGTLAADRTRSLAAHGRPLNEALIGGYHLSFLVAALFAAAGLLIALLLVRPPRPSVPERARAEAGAVELEAA